MGFTRTLAKTTGAVITRRARGRRRHPNWSLAYEVAVELCASSIATQGELEVTPGGQRHGVRATPVAPRLWRQLEFERTQLAGLPAEALTPKRPRRPDSPTFLYLHGGGYVTCSPATHRGLVAGIAHASSARTIAVDYRKAPEHPFPSGIEDCVRAYRALLDGGVDPRRLFVGGDSAGGGLTLALVQRLREAGLPQPAATVLLSPWVDLTAREGSLLTNDPFDYLDPEQLESVANLYVGDADPSLPLASPIFADLSDLPPMLVLTGSHELFLDQNLAFVARAREHGVDVHHEIGPDMVHVYPLLADISPTARAAIEAIGHFVDSHA